MREKILNFMKLGKIKMKNISFYAIVLFLIDFINYIG